MDGFDHILNWRLMAGSHRFPGQDGGTCINEAALVAARFEHQPLRSVDTMPGCFSRPICRLAMLLIDHATDRERQRLLPFVTRLACADTPEIERERADYIDRYTQAYHPLPFEVGLAVLEGALAIGCQAHALAPERVKTRMDAVRTTAATPTSVPDDPWFLTIKSWFTTKQTEPAA